MEEKLQPSHLVVVAALTNVGLAEEAPALGRRRGRRGILDLRRRRRAGLAHAVGSVHLGGCTGGCIARVRIQMLWGVCFCVDLGEGTRTRRRRRFV